MPPSKRRLHLLTCEHCGEEVQRPGRYSRPNKPRRFCSVQCATAANRDGSSKHPLYRRWRTMRDRCKNPHDKAWPNYGGRGIRVCDEWDQSFWKFLADVGSPPDDGQRWSLDRIDNDGNYEPGNVRWATAFTQANNSRKSRIAPRLDYIREQLAAGRTPAAIGKELGLGRSVLSGYISRRPDLFPDH